MHLLPGITYLILLLFRLLHLKIPAFILTFTKIGAQANTFLAMAMLGLGLELSVKKNTLFDPVISL